MKKANTISICIVALAVLFVWASRGDAASGYFSAECASCHFDDPPTCSGCHAHGVHSNSGKGDINLSAITDKTNYVPGETVTVTLNGGYRSGWVRAVLYDENGNEVARSSGSDGTGGGSGLPILLSALAPNAPGIYTYSASWYGNERDSASAAFGDWMPDPNNPLHGEEVVLTNQFEVAQVNSCTDNDGDGYALEGATCDEIDCNDSDPLIHPGAIEDCTDGLDNDCNGLIDILDPNAVNCPTNCSDLDGDGFSIEGGTCGPVDCDDTNPGVSPGADEVCTDGADNDCNGMIDGADPVCSIAGSDYDIVKLKCEKKGEVGEKIKVKVDIKNMGTADPGAVLNLYGVLDGIAIPLATDLLVFNKGGRGKAKQTFIFYPDAPGLISWFANLDDGNPDVDEAQCTTMIKADDEEEDDDDEEDDD